MRTEGTQRLLKTDALARLEKLVFPPSLYCLCCGNYVDESRSYSLCDHCIRRMSFGMRDLKAAGSRDSLPEMYRYVDSAAAAMGYGTYERRLVFELKYNGRTYAAGHIADILYDCLLKRLAETGDCPWLSADVIVPVPLHERKLRERGFNQAEKIGRHLGARTGIATCADALVRKRDTTAQRGLSAEERRENVRGAFAVSPKRAGRISGKRILLLDDIHTTGATAAACGKALKEAGAARVDFLALLTAKDRDHSAEFAELTKEVSTGDAPAGGVGRRGR